MRTDQEYIDHNPFDGDRDVRIECQKITIVTLRKRQLCIAYGLTNTPKHYIEPGQRARKETAKVDGQFGSCYQCLSCMDTMIADRESYY